MPSATANLNPLYVYESKMAFLIRMAQTRQGAEKMMDARIFTVLAQCDYLDARPEADQAFMGENTESAAYCPLLTSHV